ncbi:hypothetical protein ACH5RR_016294 [Cinchona calisaya]|uniref:Zinc finger, CCHC-type n=1 Tax=Cinchona calisaya TaxID=153742 RepID=A0ABD2ZVG8_9GENT
MGFTTLRKMATDFVKLEHFDGGNFRRWQKKMHFFLATLNVVYVFNTPKPMENDEETLANTRTRQKWENDDYICRRHILNDMSKGLFDTNQNVSSSRELWDKLEAKYMKEDTTTISCLDCFVELGSRMPDC